MRIGRTWHVISMMTLTKTTLEVEVKMKIGQGFLSLSDSRLLRLRAFVLKNDLTRFTPVLVHVRFLFFRKNSYCKCESSMVSPVFGPRGIFFECKQSRSFASAYIQKGIYIYYISFSKYSRSLRLRVQQHTCQIPWSVFQDGTNEKVAHFTHVRFSSL